MGMTKKRILIIIGIIALILIINIFYSLINICIGMSIGHRSRITGKCSEKYINACDSIWVKLLYRWDSSCTPSYSQDLGGAGNIIPVASLTPEKILSRSGEYENKEVELRGIIHLAGLGTSDKLDGMPILEYAFTVNDGAVAVSGKDLSQYSGKVLKVRGIFSMRNNNKYKIGQLTIPTTCTDCIDVE